MKIVLQALIVAAFVLVMTAPTYAQGHHQGYQQHQYQHHHQYRYHHKWRPDYQDDEYKPKRYHQQDDGYGYKPKRQYHHHKYQR